jgi:hypothetical protein
MARGDFRDGDCLGRLGNGLHQALGRLGPRHAAESRAGAAGLYEGG